MKVFRRKAKSEVSQVPCVIGQEAL